MDVKAIGRVLRAVGGTLALASVLHTTSAAALTASSTVDSRLRLDWEVGTRHGRSVIQGYVYNDHLRAAADVRLLVETLDASGAITGRTVGFVRGIVGFNDRSYFEVPLRTPGTSYRVSITAADWRDCGGGAAGGGGGGGM